MQQTVYYEIKNLYIGELTFIIPLVGDNLNYDFQEMRGLLNKQRNKGIICHNSEYLSYDNRFKHVSFLVLFYRLGDKLLCLHNKYEYDLSQQNRIKNLTPFLELIPSDLDIMPMMNIFEAFYTFRTLVDNKCNNSIEYLYNNLLYSPSDFVVGNVYICDSYVDDYFKCVNIPQNYMLEKSSALLTGKLQTKKYINNKINSYNYSIYKCLLLKYKNSLLNLHDNRIYNSVASSSLSGFVNGDNSGCEVLFPFEELLSKSHLSNYDESITIKDALNLYNKIKVYK